MAKVMLWWPDVTVDDHERPRHRLWRYYHYPESACELIVCDDGTVVEAATLFDEALYSGVAVRHKQVMDSTSRVAIALSANGYELRSVQ